MTLDIWEAAGSTMDPWTTEAARRAADDDRASLAAPSYGAAWLEGVFHPNIVEGPGTYPIEMPSEWLGDSYLTRLAGRRAEVTLPRLSAGLRDSGALEPPLFLADSVPWDDWVFPKQPQWPKWGDQDVRPGCSRVRDFRIAVLIEDAAEYQQVAKEVHDDLHRWWRNAEQWIELLSGQDLRGRDRFKFSAGSATLWSTNSDGSRSHHQGRSEINQVSWPTLGFGHTTFFGSAVQAAGLGHEPPFEWQTLRAALAAFERDQYERTVVEAGVASERALVRYLLRLRTGDKKRAPQPGKERTPRMATMVQLEREEASRHGRASVIPETFTDLVSSRRDRVVHQGWRPNRTEATESLAMATEVIHTILPREFLTEPYGLCLRTDPPAQ